MLWKGLEHPWGPRTSPPRIPRGDCICLCQQLTLTFLGASQVGLVLKNLSANARDVRDSGSIPGSGGSPGGGHGNTLQYSFLENPKTEEPSRLVQRVANSQTWLRRLSMHPLKILLFIKAHVILMQSSGWGFLVHVNGTQLRRVWISLQLCSRQSL